MDAMTDTPNALRRHVRQVWPSYFDASIWFTFLLRSDVRGDAGLDDEEARKRFLIWFFCFGRKQYLCSTVTEEQRRVFWESVPFPQAPGSWTVPRILAYVLDVRSDVVQAMRATEDGGLNRALAWLLLHGLKEFGLYDVLTDGVRDWLDSPAAQDDRSDLPLTNLAMLVWSFRTDLHAAHELSTVAGCRRFTAWIYTAGLREETLWPLLSKSRAEAIEGRMILCGGQPLSWHAQLCWLAGVPGVPPEAPASADAAAALCAWYGAERPSFFTGRVLPASPGRPAAWRVPSPTARGCNLVGYAYGELGVGEDVRMMAASLLANAVPFSITDCSDGLQSRRNDHSVAGHVTGDLRHGATVFCFTGFDSVRFFLEKGSEAMQGRYAIGYWPWELPRWPEAWRAAFGLVDEIWVSSRFTQEAFCLAAPIPVVHMPMAVELPQAAPLTRRDFGLPDNACLFLYVFDAHSYLDRKNPMAAVQAFRRAFPRGDEPAGLVLKVMNAGADNPQWQEVLRHSAPDPRIRVVSGTLDKPQSLALVRLCDVYLSLHRSEGFGRTIAEAMLLERPIIATAWSGSDELVRTDTAIPIPATPIAVEPGQYPWGEGMHWAEPDLDQAAWSMRLLAGDGALRARLGAAGRDFVRRHHNAQVVGRRYRERLAALDLL